MKGIISKVLCLLAAVGSGVSSPVHFHDPYEQHATHNHSKRAELDWQYCANYPQQVQTLIWAYEDALEIVKKAETALTNLISFMGTTGQSREDANAWNAPLFNTFESIFGKILPKENGQPDTDTFGSLLSRPRILSLLQVASKMVIALSSEFGQKIELHCDDDFLKLREPAIRKIYYDSRPLARGGDVCMEYKGTCQDRTAVAFTWLPQGVSFDVTVYCNWMMGNWASNRISNLVSPPLDGTFSLDVVSNFFAALTVVHETSHSSVLLGSDTWLTDVPCPGGAATYGWQCITDIATQSDVLAITNADSFAYFAVAMYLDKWDWSTGLARAR